MYAQAPNKRGNAEGRDNHRRVKIVLECGRILFEGSLGGGRPRFQSTSVQPMKDASQHKQTLEHLLIYMITLGVADA